MTFVQALNNEDTRSLIDLIEECDCDLDRKPGDRTLLEMRADFVQQLAEAGYDYAA